MTDRHVLETHSGDTWVSAIVTVSGDRPHFEVVFGLDDFLATERFVAFRDAQALHDELVLWAMTGGVSTPVVESDQREDKRGCP
jgi:hypothetical protein